VAEAAALGASVVTLVEVEVAAAAESSSSFSSTLEVSPTNLMPVLLNMLTWKLTQLSGSKVQGIIT
jgi:hypothetical protein